MIKKERSGTAFLSSGSPTLEIPQLPPTVEPRGRRRGLFVTTVNEDDKEAVAKEEDFKWHKVTIL